MNNITKIREKRDMSRLDLSNKSGLSRQSIYNIEKNLNNCTLKNLIKVAKALDVDVRELI